MKLSSWLRTRQRYRSPRTLPSFRPKLEALDDRLVPSNLAVTNNLDTGAAGDGSLRGEIAAARSDDTIVFDPSLGGQTITLSGYGLYIDKNLTIEGLGANSLAISGGSQSEVFAVAHGVQVALSGITIENGKSFAASGTGWDGSHFDGGGILNSGSLALSGDTLSGNAALYGHGGGIANYGVLTVTGSILSGNSATYDGGGIANFGALTVTGTIVSGNSGSHGGGGIANEYGGTATVTGGTLSGNSAMAGGGVYNDGTMTLGGTTVTKNRTGTSLPSGGGIYNDFGGSLTVFDCVVTGNSPDDVYNVGKWKHQKSTIGKVDG
jgi:hypothetical protein